MSNSHKPLDDIALKETTSVDGLVNSSHPEDHLDHLDGNAATRLLPPSPTDGLPAFSPTDGLPAFSSDGETKSTDADILIEMEAVKPLMYRISESPPPHLLLMFALQQSLLSISSPLTVCLIVAELICGQYEEDMKIKILSASFFMVGLSTFTMSTFGVRLPIFQGPAGAYLIPLIAMSSLPDWTCPVTFTSVNPVDNSSVVMAIVGNGTVLPARELMMSKIAGLSGSLVLAGCLHFLIGVTGLVGLILRYVGPVTVVPAISLVGLFIYQITVKFCQTNWLVAILTSMVTFILSFYLENKQTPMPFWSPRKGFHILWFPFHQAFSVLLSIIFGWVVSVILTEADALTDDPTSTGYLARTDARIHVIAETDWFIFPYPGKFGGLGFSAAGFSSFFVATIMSVMDSIGDYNACARAVRVPPPATYAFNRGIAVEGLMCILSGTMGCCHPTLSYGGNIGAIKLTGVASRSVFQLSGIIYIIFAIFGKIGAVFINIPYSVLGGTSIAINGMFIGLVLSYLQFIDLNSSRNLAIIGSSFLSGMMMPYWVQNNPSAINTGNMYVDNLFQVLLSNPSFVGGVMACFLDNTIPGTLKERGLLSQLKELDDEEAKLLAQSYEDGEEVYDLPFIPESFSRSKMAKYIPFLRYTGK